MAASGILPSRGTRTSLYIAQATANRCSTTPLLRVNSPSRRDSHRTTPPLFQRNYFA